MLRYLCGEAMYSLCAAVASHFYHTEGALAVIISTTANIEGKPIRNYLGIVSGTDIYLVGGLIGGGLINQEHLYTDALNRATEKMTEKAVEMGANAIVGVTTNITSPGGLNYIIVVVTGTAVIIDGGDTPMNSKINGATPANLPPAAVTSGSAADKWTCKHCGTSNSTNYGQCKKCGKYKNA